MSSFQLGSGREALAPLSAAALEDRAAGAGRHPRAKSVPALAASNVRLEGAFHEAEERDVSGRRRSPATGQYREAQPADRLRRVPLRQPRTLQSENLEVPESTGPIPHGARR